jgi:hypothetical protein
VEPANLPPQPGLSGSTLRQVVRVSLGGRRVRVRFTNAFGSGPVTLRSARLAAPAGEGEIEPGTDRSLSFGGREEVTLGPGASAASDPLRFALKPRSLAALTVHFGAAPAGLTGHPGSRTTSYLAPGDQASAAALRNAVRTDHWYFIHGIDVDAPEPAAAVVVLGNSITDGRGSGRTGGPTSWRAASRRTPARGTRPS